MSELLADCPRCGALRTTFDMVAHIAVDQRYKWQTLYESFCICRHCVRATIFVVSERGVDEARFLERESLSGGQFSANNLVEVEHYISEKDENPRSIPDYLPENIANAFREGASCLTINCVNAAATMFRLSIDLATRSLLPEENIDGLNNRTRRSLGLRLGWLFEQSKLPSALEELSSCVKDDGNDGAHEGSLTSDDAEDLFDFAFMLLERLYTEPERLRIARERRNARRENTT